MTIFPTDLIESARMVVQLALAANMRVSTAESCTGGLISAALTEIPGSSAMFGHGFVTYSNQAKIQLIDVPAPIIERFGAVSAETARAMANGALRKSGADMAVSATGIAGPDGGTANKPVGLVFLGLAVRGQESLDWKLQLSGDRASVRLQTALTALAKLEQAIRAR